MNSKLCLRQETKATRRQRGGSREENAHHQDAGLLPIHEALWDGVRSQDFVPVEGGKHPQKHRHSVPFDLNVLFPLPNHRTLP